MKKIVIPAVLGLGLLWVMSKRNFVKTTNWTFEKMQIDLKKKKIYVFLGVQNPTGQSLTINSIVGNLIINNSTVATIESYDKQKINPTSKSLIKLQLVPSAMGLFEQAKAVVLQLLSKGKKTAKQAIKSTFKGAANVEGTTFPIDLKLMS